VSLALSCFYIIGIAKINAITTITASPEDFN